jgi:hypothetical protein
VFLLYYRDFFEQICSDVQFISPPEEVGEFLLHLLKTEKPRKPYGSGVSYVWTQCTLRYSIYILDVILITR